MVNGYFSTYSALPRHQNARSESLNAIFDAIVVGFDNVPAAAALQQDRVTHCTDTGAADAYVIAPTYLILSYVAGQHFTFVATHANTMASTVNVSTLGVKTIKRQDGTDLSAGDIASGQMVDIRYDGTNFQLLSVPSGSVAAAAASAAAAAVSNTASGASATASAASATQAAASATTAGATVSQWAVAGGTADAITATFPTTVTGLTDGLVLGFRASAANATTTPTFKADGTTAHTITKKGGAALLAGDIPGALAECTVRYNLANTRWELQSPAPRVAFSDSDFRIQDNGDATKQVAFEVSGVTTGTTRTITVLNASITLARTDAAQTFTGQQTFATSIQMTGGISLSGNSMSSSGAQLNVQYGSAAAGDPVMAIGGANNFSYQMSLCESDALGANNSRVSIQIQKVASTGRSVSAAGTINASGADYAEYETKASDCGTIAKGQIIGFDADGNLTDKFSAAISFGIKSTDPSYVGGDVWGNDEAIGMGKPANPGNAPERQDGELDEDFAARQIEYEAALADFNSKTDALNAALEVARAKVDRVAYCGKVPVNVTGASPGDHIIASQADGDMITGLIVSAPLTLDQYLKSVGRVRRVLADGRAVVSVNVH